MERNSKFEKLVLKACAKIPRGKITTYKFLAKAVGNPKAARAVGNVLNKNENLQKIPCYRVIKSDGSVGSYSKGRKMKILLLKNDGIKIKNGKIVNFEKYLFRFQK